LKRFNIAPLELNCFVIIIGYKHFAPTVLIIINGNNIAAEQWNVYRTLYTIILDTQKDRIEKI